MINKISLRHLQDINHGDGDLSRIMIDLLDFKNNWFNRKFVFVKAYKKVFNIIEELREIDFSKLELSPDCSINIPSHIDNITFSAMMDIQTYTADPGTEDDFEIMAEVITMACFSENKKSKYAYNEAAYKSFKEIIYNQPAIHMVGIYNWINQALKDSQKLWDKRFMSVYVSDDDYVKSGGPEAMLPFNVINTIKSLCIEFNVTYEEAWQLPYSLSQVNSFAKATESHVQDKMRQIKEARIELERKTK